MKNDYTYDYNGKIMTIVGFKPDNLPKLPENPNKENSIKFKISDLLNNQALRRVKKKLKKQQSPISDLLKLELNNSN